MESVKIVLHTPGVDQSATRRWLETVREQEDTQSALQIGVPRILIQKGSVRYR